MQHMFQYLFKKMKIFSQENRLLLDFSLLFYLKPLK